MSKGTAQQALIEHTKSWHMPRAEYLDSTLNVFHTTQSSEQKLDVALQLYREFSFSEEGIIKTAKKLSVSEEEVRSWGAVFKNYLDEALEKSSNQDRLAEYEILGIRSLKDVQGTKKLLKQNPDAYTQLDSTLMAVWLARKGFHSRREKSTKPSSGIVHKAIEMAPKTDNNLALVSNLCKLLGDGFYHLQRLDSAEYYYSIPANLYEKNKSRKMDYSPGYGIHQRTEAMGNVLMNLGLINERKGNLLRATHFYEEANAIYRLKNKEGTHWSNVRLMNAFFDIGDTKSARRQLRKIANESLVSLKGSKRYAPRYTTNLFSELEPKQLKAHAPFLDSLLNAEITYLYGDTRKENVEAKKLGEGLYAYFRTEICFYHLWLKQLGMPKEVNGFDLDELEFWVHQQEQKHQEDSIKFKSAAPLRLILLSWKAARSGNTSESVHYTELLHLLEQLPSTSDVSFAVRQASWVMGLYGKYTQEVELVNFLIPRVKQTSHKVTLVALYAQAAIAYEQLGQYEQAIAYRNQQDSLASEINATNQHEALATLDKQLEVAKAKKNQALLQMENSELRSRRLRLYLVIASLSIIFVLLAGLLHINRKRVLARKKQLEAEKELLASDLKNEAEKVRLASLEILKGNQSFTQLVADIESLKTELSPENRKKVLGLLINHKTKTQEDIWQQFNLQFQSHYQNFYLNLVKKYPDLTENEQRLCAMHLSNLTNKEINAITGQKISSIHTMKSKVRKKMQVENDQDLRALLEALL